jgi:hypothetical protein
MNDHLNYVTDVFTLYPFLFFPLLLPLHLYVCTSVRLYFCTVIPLLKWTTSGELIRASPNFLINSGNPDYDTYYAWASITALSTTEFSTKVAMVTSLSDDAACTNSLV